MLRIGLGTKYMFNISLDRQGIDGWEGKIERGRQERRKTKREEVAILNLSIWKNNLPISRREFLAIWLMD